MLPGAAMDHDRLFKELLTTFFGEFLELFFSELVADLDRDSIEFLDKEIFTDVTHGDRHAVDLVAKYVPRALLLPGSCRNTKAAVR